MPLLSDNVHYVILHLDGAPLKALRHDLNPPSPPYLSYPSI
ncbi:hypothetical protein HMPREF0281_00369 [Corynebacterium ammoniagenes DSM 20306]|uniref:Uncharacterized protein n=1 Tax=Corynebacterium ammoniagenes DSM 20306 TaxID=649754 RepID=A0ABN0AHJ7_CORAM|nr:hypothetical protein HMPREF0281_00369 [Corynebacterium ammoniagenes DSM 20306]